MEMEILSILTIAIVVNVFLSSSFILKLIAEKSELEEANKELDEVIKTQAKQIEELNAKLLSKKGIKHGKLR